jgi:hypothetical protein
MNTAPNINGCLSINTKAYQAAISSPLQWHHNPVNHPVIEILCPEMNEEYLTPNNMTETTHR